MTVVLTSPTNPVVKTARQLGQHPGQHPQGWVLVEGRHPVAEALAAGWTLVEGFVQATGPGASQWEALPQTEKAPVHWVSPAVMAKLATTASPPPLCAVMTPPARGMLTWDTLSQLTACRLLVLDGLQDPGNVGTLIRSAVAFGATGMLLLAPFPFPYAPKVIRASAGLVFRLPLLLETQRNTQDALQQLQQAGLQVALTAGAGTPTQQQHTSPAVYSAWHPSTKHALVLGSEGTGIRLAAATDWTPYSTLTIPLAPGVDSLNVAVSGSIFLAHWAAHCNEA